MVKTVIRRNPKTAWRKYGDSMIIITNHDTALHKLNQSGTEIWEFLGKQRKTIEEVINHMVNIYKVDKKKINKEINSYLQLLIEKKIVVVDG